MWVKQHTIMTMFGQKNPHISVVVVDGVVFVVLLLLVIVLVLVLVVAVVAVVAVGGDGVVHNTTIMSIVVTSNKGATVS